MSTCTICGNPATQIDHDIPLYGLSVTGTVAETRVVRNAGARPGDGLVLTKPLGIGVLNTRHKATGEVFHEAVAAMTTHGMGPSRGQRDLP